MAASSLTNLTFSFHPYSTHTPKLSHLKIQTLSIQNPTKSFQISSKPSFLSLQSPPHKNISKILIQNVASLLLGSLIFTGSLKTRPVLANPVQETESLEQKEGTQFAKSSETEEEMMYVKLFEQNPKNVDALKMVVNVKMRKGKSNEAVEYVEKLIKLQPNEMEWRLLQAFCYEMMGSFSKAKSLFKNILKQNPLLLRALHGLAMVMHKNHEGPAVFEMLESALEVAQRRKKVNEERNIKILMAQMHIVKGNLVEALEKFQALIDENPRDFRPYLCQGIVYSLLEKTKEAEESFEIYRGLVPEEFPQRGFLDDVVLAAKTETRQKLEKDIRGL